jgi:hypothetical protein
MSEKAPRRKNGGARVKKERKDKKRRTGIWCLGGKGKGKSHGRDNYIRVPKDCRISTTDTGIFNICSQGIETQKGYSRLGPIEKENAKLQFYILKSISMRKSSRYRIGGDIQGEKSTQGSSLQMQRIYWDFSCNHL